MASETCQRDPSTIQPSSEPSETSNSTTPSNIIPKLAPFNPTNDTAISAALQLLDLTPQDTLYDLGCGDGRVLHRAATLTPGLRCVGIESDVTFVQRAHAMLEQQQQQNENETEDQIRVLQGNVLDFKNVVVKEATAIFVYLVPKGLLQVKPMLERFLKGGGGGNNEKSESGEATTDDNDNDGKIRRRIASNLFAIPGWEPTKVLSNTKGGWPVYLYDEKNFNSSD